MDKFMVHGKKERKRRRIIIIIIIIRNGAKTISLQTLFGRLNYGHLCNVVGTKRSQLLYIYIYIQYIITTIIKLLCTLDLCNILTYFLY